jgi:hypothetical protein
MKMNARKTLAILVLVLVFATTTLASGASMTSPVSATMDKSIMMLWNGSPFTPVEADGSVLSPIVYNNRTYLPARALLEKAGYTVGYNAATKTILIDGQGTIPPAPAANTYTFDTKASMPKGTISQTTMILSPDAVLSLNGVKSKLDFSDVAKLGEFDASSVKIITDDRGMVTSIEAIGTPSSGEASKFTITITVSYPPIKVVITVRF